MNPHQLTVLAAVAVLLGSITWMSLAETPVVSPGPPRSTATAPALLAASVPAIGDFDREFHVNIDNPFVPFAERDADVKAHRPRPVRMPTELTPRPAPPPENLPVVAEPPKLVLPGRKAQRDDTPECIGILRHGPSGQAVVMTKNANEAVRPLAVGEVIAGWTLRAIGVGVVTFERPDGGEEILPVGPAASNVSPAAGTPAATPGTPPNTAVPGPANSQPMQSPPSMVPIAPGEPRMLPQSKPKP